MKKFAVKKQLSTNQIVLGLVCLWALFVLLSVTRANSLLLDIIGFPILTLVPGLLLASAIGWLKKRRLYELAYILGANLLLLMAVPLIINMLLPLVGVKRPLDQIPLLASLSAVVCLFAGIALRKNVKIKKFSLKPKLGRPDIAILTGGISLTALSIFGAITLNNGGSGDLNTIMLSSAVVYIIALIAWSRRILPGIVPIGIYFLSLSLLLMTSLRGWGVTGHDIQIETHVFELARQNGIWNIDAYRDAYNACMSVTILPTVFANLLQQPNELIFKIYFQLLFAITPVLVYWNMRRFLNAMCAIIASVYFITLPTFFTDMPMLNRQEIAFIFVGLMILALLDKRYPIMVRRGLFLLFSVGMILSHYSTTYAMIAIFSLAYAMRPGVVMVADSVRNVASKLKKGIDKPTGFQFNRSLLTMPMFIFLFLLTIVWTNVITNTSSGVTNTIAKTVEAVKHGFSSDSRSNDANKLLSFQDADINHQLSMYKTDVVDQQRAAVPSTYVYDSKIVNHYEIKAVPDATSKPTSAATFLGGYNVNVSSLASNLKRITPRILAVFALVGMAYVALRARRSDKIPPEMITLSIASLIFVAMQIVLPVVSVEYGLMRAYQQALFVLGAFLVIGSFVIFKWLRFARLNYILPVAMLLVYFISNTGLINTAFGGFEPTLNSSNSGMYYDVYYPHSTEVAAADWLVKQNKHLPPNHRPIPIQAERYVTLRLAPDYNLPIVEGIYPSLIDPNNYVLLGYTNIHKEQSSVFYQGNIINFKYPTKFLDDNKNLVYSTSGSRIYK